MYIIGYYFITNQKIIKNIKLVRDGQKNLLLKIYQNKIKYKNQQKSYQRNYLEWYQNQK